MTDDNVSAMNGDEVGETTTGSARIPPYISFQTLLTFLSELKTNGMPPQIDKSVLRRFSGGMQGQLKMAVRSLGLMEGDKPTPRLKALVDAHETPAFEPLLLEILKETYPYVFALDLLNATPTMFADAFKATGAKEDVSRKCRSFFLHAAKRAGVPLGNRILTGSVPRAPSNGTAKKKPKAAKAVDPALEAGGVAAAQTKQDQISDIALEYKLVDLMKEDGVGDAERGAIWTLIQYLTSKAKNTATSR